MSSTTTDRRLGVNSGQAIKVPCLAATTANVTLSGEQTIDGVALVTGDRVLVKNQTDTTKNGIYEVDTGTWERTKDFDGTLDVCEGTLVMVLDGTTNSNTYWRVTSDNPVVPESSAITFASSLAGDSALLTFLQAGTSAVSRSAQDKMRERISVGDFGAVGDDVTDDYAAIMAAYQHLVALGGGVLEFDGAKTYRTSNRLLFKASNMRYEGNGCRIHNVSVLGAYQRDGIVIGNPSATDGGTGVGIATSNVIAHDFEFTNARIGLWVVYSRNVIIDTIRADNVAVVAVGNDADDECENVTVTNIFRTALFNGSFYTVGIYNCAGFRLTNVTSRYAVSGAAVMIVKSSGVINGLVIDQVNGVNNGLVIEAEAQYVEVSNFYIKSCASAIVTFDSNAPTRDKIAVIGGGVILGCTTALNVQASGTLFHDIQTVANTTSLSLGSDAQANRFYSCRFREGVLSDASGVKYLQFFAGCEGVSSRVAFSATNSTGATNFSGDGTTYTLTYNTEVLDVGGDFVPGTGIFTAPRDGLYHFTGQAGITDQATSGHTKVRLSITTTGTAVGAVIDEHNVSSDGSASGSATIWMAKGDTAKLTVTAFGGTKTADIIANANFNQFGGYMVSGAEL